MFHGRTVFCSVTKNICKSGILRKTKAQVRKSGCKWKNEKRNTLSRKREESFYCLIIFSITASDSLESGEVVRANGADESSSLEVLMRFFPFSFKHLEKPTVMSG